MQTIKVEIPVEWRKSDKEYTLPSNVKIDLYFWRWIKYEIQSYKRDVISDQTYTLKYGDVVEYFTNLEAAQQAAINHFIESIGGTLE